VDERVVEQRPRRERAARCAVAAEGHVELLRLDHGERLGRIDRTQDEGMTSSPIAPAAAAASSVASAVPASSTLELATS
jgi:hypothetical protein